MATPIISFGFLALFKPVFIFLFIFALFYAVLNKTEILGANKGIQFLVSFSVAMLFMFAADPLEFVDLVIPWLGVLLIVFMSFVVLFMFIGIKGETIVGAISQPGISWTLIITLIVLLVIALTKVFGAQVASLTQDLPDGADDKNFMSDVGEIVFSTKVLGMFLLILIAAMAIRALGKVT
jgi:hypothetical protein